MLKMYVGNLSPDTRETHIRELFSQHGKVRSIRLAADVFEIKAHAPLAVDPKALAFGLAGDLTRELAIAIPVLVVHNRERQAQHRMGADADPQPPLR